MHQVMDANIYGFNGIQNWHGINHLFHFIFFKNIVYLLLSTGSTLSASNWPEYFQMVKKMVIG